MIEAAQRAARLFSKNFARVWLLGFVWAAIAWLPLVLVKLTVLATGDDLIDRLEPYWSVPYNILLFVPVQAGLFLAMSRRIDGRPARVRDLFEAFRSCYGQAIIAGLVPVLLSSAMVPLVEALSMVPRAADGVTASAPSGVVVLGSCCGVIVFIVAGMVLALLFAFALIALWDTPQSGLAAIRTSVRIVWRHFWSVLGAHLLFSGALVGVTSPGWIAYAVGHIAIGTPLAKLMGNCAAVLTFMAVLPLVAVWFDAMLIYLYRSWTGQPQVKPMPAAAMPEAPAPPESEPPAV